MTIQMPVSMLAFFIVLALGAALIPRAQAAGPSDELRTLQKIERHLKSIRKSQAGLCRHANTRTDHNFRQPCGMP